MGRYIASEARNVSKPQPIGPHDITVSGGGAAALVHGVTNRKIGPCTTTRRRIINNHAHAQQMGIACNGC